MFKFDNVYLSWYSCQCCILVLDVWMYGHSMLHCILIATPSLYILYFIWSCVLDSAPVKEYFSTRSNVLSRHVCKFLKVSMNKEMFISTCVLCLTFYDEGKGTITLYQDLCVEWLFQFCQRIDSLNYCTIASEFDRSDKAYHITHTHARTHTHTHCAC